MAVSRTALVGVLASSFAVASLLAARDTAQSAPAAGTERTITVVTWNVQKCEHGVAKVGDALRATNADVICLQELIEPRQDSAKDATAVRQSDAAVNQTRVLAERLGMHCASFGGPLDDSHDQCIAILSRFPLSDVQRLGSDPQRNLGIAAIVHVNQKSIRVASVHLAGTWRLNAEHIIATSRARDRDWRELHVAASGWSEPTVIAGDFNTDRRSAWFAERLGGLSLVSPNEATLPATRPALFLDHMLAGSAIESVESAVPPTDTSDHRPVRVVLRLR